MTRALALAIAGLCGCGGITGTIALELVTAPGSTVLADLTRARLTLSDPLTVVEVERGDDGRFRLELDVLALGPAGQLTFEGFDAGGARRALGRTPGLPVAAIDADVAIYVAAPDTLAAAPALSRPPATSTPNG